MFKRDFISIPANTRTRVNLSFKMVRILAIAGASNVNISFEFEPEQSWRAGLGLRFPQMQSWVDLNNTSAGSITVEMAFSDNAEIVDSSLVMGTGALAVSQAAAATNFSYGFKIDVQTTQSIAANTNRKGLDIRNVGSAPLFVSNGPTSGAGGDDSHGFRINPGEVFSPGTTGQISFRNNTSLAAGTQLYSFVEYA